MNSSTKIEYFRFENVKRIIKSIGHVKVSKEDFINYTVS